MTLEYRSRGGGLGKGLLGSECPNGATKAAPGLARKSHGKIKKAVTTWDRRF